ncbi:hypothetical protein MMC10_001732 [Thelotrema lepadinum]|nr:hypothetical protein [Thelotrema lepadinum]
MSGLEGVAALSFICNIFQLINFGHETISVFKRVASTGRADLSLARNGQSLENVTIELEDRLRDKPKPLDRQDDQLLDIASDCVKAAKDLQTSIDDIKVAEGQRNQKRAIFTSTIRAIRDKGKIQQQEKTMLRCQHSLQTYLAMNSRIKLDAIEIQSHEDFINLSHDLQTFITQCAAGSTTLKHLIVQESSDIKNHITAESSKVQSNILEGLMQELWELQRTSRSEHQYERLLASLKFPGMNERLNRIESQHAGTFSWIFNHHNDATSPISYDAPSSPLCASSRPRSLHEGRDLHCSVEGVDDTPPHNFPPHNFPEWLASSRKLYWISGKPGSGKSTLVKYLASAPETKIALDKWHPDTRILMHYLWFSGTPMQRNIKGLLCSLLHQAYEGNRQSVFQTMSTRPSFISKDLHSDWSLNELKESLLTFIQETSNHFCIFLDGLDEIDQKDGLYNLLRLLDEFEKLPRLKLCVSSRPQPAIMAHLQNHPSLRIHEHTLRDIWTYATRIVRVTSDIENDFKIVGTIVEKAAGVFLWVVLVTKSIERGLGNGDKWPDIQARLNSLPNDMMALYQSMWEKLGEDQKWYSETAALYFEIKLLDSIKSHYGTNLTNRQLSIFELMASTDVDVQNSFFGEGRVLPPADLEKRCSWTVRRLLICCGGLLEVRKSDGRSIFDSLDKRYHCLSPYINQAVVFVHKTAQDFLESTEDGKSIRKACSTEAAIAALIKGCFIQCRLSNSGLNDIPCKPLNFAIDVRLFLEHASVIQDCRENLISIIARWYEEGYLIRGQGHTSFIAIAAAVGLIPYVECQIANRTVDLLESGYLILGGLCSFFSDHRDFSVTYDFPKDYERRNRLIRRLIGHHVFDRQSTRGRDQSFPLLKPIDPITSAFMCFLDSSLATLDDTIIKPVQECDFFLSWCKETLATIRVFTLRGVNMGARIYAPITCHGYFGSVGFASLYQTVTVEGLAHLEVNIPFLINRLLARLHPDAGVSDGDRYSCDFEYVRLRVFTFKRSGSYGPCDYAPGTVEDEQYLWNVLKPFIVETHYPSKPEQELQVLERIQNAMNLILPRAGSAHCSDKLRESFKHLAPCLRNNSFGDPLDAPRRSKMNRLIKQKLFAKDTFIR